LAFQPCGRIPTPAPYSGFWWIGDLQGIIFRRLDKRYAGAAQAGFLASKRAAGKLL